MKVLKIIIGSFFIFISIGGFISKDFLLATVVLLIGLFLVKSAIKNKKVINSKKTHDDNIQIKEKEDKSNNVIENKDNKSVKNVSDINNKVKDLKKEPDDNVGLNKNENKANNVIKIKNDKPVKNTSSKDNEYNNLNSNLKDFTIIDFETTGISVFNNEIIEIGAIKVRDLEIVDTYETLCNPLKSIENDFIHGIKDSDVLNYKYPTAYMDDLLAFIGDDTVFAYNAPFDIEFLNSYLKDNIPNKVVDVLSLARARENRESYKLVDVRKDLNINTECHRSVGDCEATLEYYKYMLFEYDIKRLQYCNIDSDLSKLRAKRSNKYADYILEKHTADSSTFENQHYFYDKNICFSGDFENLSKADAYLKIIDIGGNIQKNVTLKTNILVLGNQNTKTTKEKKADEYNLRPNINIEKVYEKDFLKLLNK